MAEQEPLYAQHPRRHGTNRFVYPVFARRSRGISIGINLNPDRRCNFDCIYCQVDRRGGAEESGVDEPALLAELEDMLGLVTSGRIYEEPRFRQVPEAHRRLNDIAFSGDGEPTSFKSFPAIVEGVAAQKRALGLDDVKLVLITNASLLDRPAVIRAVSILDQNQGEIWGKLDAGTDAYHRSMTRSEVPLSRIVQNLTLTARGRPIVIQSMFLRMHGQPPDQGEIDAYAARLNDIQGGGGEIRLVQVYTVSRIPAEAWATSIDNKGLEAIALEIRRQAGLPVEIFGA